MTSGVVGRNVGSNVVGGFVGKRVGGGSVGSNVIWEFVGKSVGGGNVGKGVGDGAVGVRVAGSKIPTVAAADGAGVDRANGTSVGDGDTEFLLTALPFPVPAFLLLFPPCNFR